MRISNIIYQTVSLFLLVFSFSPLMAEDGYRLWLRYDPITDSSLVRTYRLKLSSAHVFGQSPTLDAAGKELMQGLEGLLGRRLTDKGNQSSLLVITKASQKSTGLRLPMDVSMLGAEGFAIHTLGNKTVIAANTDVGALYGVFHFLRLLQTHRPITSLKLESRPRIRHRILNHWDNLNRHVERGYSGLSIWNWHTLPGYIDQRYIDYARANASIGINGTVLTNVNANALVLTRPYLQKLAALADAFRPYGLKVYLTARFSAPVEIGGLKTADPLEAGVKEWWKNKTNEIYKLIPDFGGFRVKANSEGQPGPQTYGRNHAEGANMLADALADHGGLVMWRAFVYSNETPEDRFKQAYNEFKPLDGQFRKNVMVQVKNGPIDFQPREPFHPLFGAMPETPLMMEFQITQEYLGQGTHLLFESPMFKEILEADTYAKGKNSSVAKIVDGSLENQTLTGMAGVANIGNDRNWTGHLFGQSNWYCFGRLAWDYELSSGQLAEEWIRQSFTNNKKFLDQVRKIMLNSHQNLVNYMTPLGLHHIMGTGHHYGPAPWVSNAGRADWNPVYYHRADSLGIGFDRTESGSKALAQYAPEVRRLYENMETCPEDFLLWFHHVPWKHKMKSGRNLWEELCYRYDAGVDSVRRMQKVWDGLENMIDRERFMHVKMLLAVQEEEAVWWRDACLLYFQTFSKMPFPDGHEKQKQTLEYYRSLRFPYAPGQG
jgi:alpha-glucuronidase